MDPFLGEIRITSFPFAPRGWGFCNGQLLSTRDYSALFSLLGNTYGGDGNVNFALPDLRGKIAIGFNETYPLGNTGGFVENVLTLPQIPPHTHGLRVSSQIGNKITPEGTYFAVAGAGDNEYSDSMSTNVTFNAGVIATTGAAAPVPNMQPYLPLSFMIALWGVFPPKS